VKLGERLLKVVDRINFWRAVRLVLIVDGLLVIAAAILERIVEPETFGSMRTALWWSVVTVGTVGYGDIVPHTTLGRTIGAATILFSLAFVPTVTSLVAAALVRRQQERQTETTYALLKEMSDRLAAIEAELARRP
jgi:voltage-gated potassium channel